MKSLTVIGNNCPSTAPWATAYPNLGYLEVSTIEQALLDLSEDSLELYLETREENRRAHLKRGTWKELETFKGAPLDLYLVGVPCRIRRLELDIMKDELRFLPIVVADALPAELVLDLASQVLNGGDNAWLLDHLRDPALSSVRALTLRLRDHLPSTADFPGFWVRCIVHPFIVSHIHRLSGSPGRRAPVAHLGLPRCQDQNREHEGHALVHLQLPIWVRLG